MGGMIPVGAANGNTVYGNFMSADDGDIADGAGLSVYNQSDYSDYIVASIENLGANRYLIPVPGYLPNGRYFCMPYVASVFGAPAPGDSPLDIIFFDWQDGNVLGMGSALNIGQINGSAPAAVNLSVSALAMARGAVVAGTISGSQMTTNLTNTVAGAYTGRVVIFTSGVNINRAALITAYVVTGGKLTFVCYNNVPLVTAPSVADTFLII